MSALLKEQAAARHHRVRRRRRRRLVGVRPLAGRRVQPAERRGGRGLPGESPWVVAVGGTQFDVIGSPTVAVR
ncbi:MAG: hypothetical protein R2699_03575 [Acidimicrobiales bacterium]